MTTEEFQNTAWAANMRAMYRGEIYPVVACDFSEFLVGLGGVTLGDDDPTWVRCENIGLLSEAL